MEAINITELRQNIRTTLDRVIQDREEIVVHRGNKGDVVLVFLDDYNSLKETSKLLSSKKNRDRLYLGMKQVEEGKTTIINISAHDFSDQAIRT